MSELFKKNFKKEINTTSLQMDKLKSFEKDEHQKSENTEKKGR